MKSVNNLNWMNMTKMIDLKKMFSDIGLGDDNSRSNFTEKIEYDFDYSKKSHGAIKEVFTSNNTKIEELCQTGTK